MDQESAGKIHDLYSEYDNTYKLGVVVAWMLSFFVIVLNCYAIVFIGTKKHRLVNIRKNQKRHLAGMIMGYKRNNINNMQNIETDTKKKKSHKFRFSVYSLVPQRIETTDVYKPDELIVVSLCFSNLFVGLAAAIKITAFITESRDPRFNAIISYVVSFSMFVSLIHILVLSLERFLAVRSPFCHQDLRNKQTGYILLVVWMLSVLPPILNANPSFSLLVSALVLISYVILVATYAFIFHMMGIAFRNSSNSTAAASAADEADEQRRQKERERRSTFSCCSIVISYILCTLLPVVKLLTETGGMNSLDSPMDVLMFVCLLMRSISDPLVYTLRNKIYNLGMNLCQCICPRRHSANNSRHLINTGNNYKNSHNNNSTDYNMEKRKLLQIENYNLNIDDEEEVYIWFQTSRETRL